MKKKKPIIKVVFDTNVIYNGSAHYLINNNIHELIQTHTNFDDLEVHWYLPETVIQERAFQMIKSGCKLLESVEKIELLLNHKLNINEEIIKDRVDSTIEKQLNENKIQKINLKINEVEWKNIITSALKRIPPFDDNKTEKGFRDALILEALIQLIEDSPTTPQSCRVIFVSNDELLMRAVKTRTEENKNVKCFSTYEDLQSFINILVSKVEEELVKNISQKASLLFFNSEDTGSSFYFKEKIRDKVKNKFSEKFKSPFNLFTQNLEEDTWYISNVNFIKKVKQRFWWSTSIRIPVKDKKYTYKPQSNQLFSEKVNTGLSDIYDSFNTLNRNMEKNRQIISNLSMNRMFSPNRESELSYYEYKKGEIKFEVIWSVTLNVKQNLINPKIEEIKYIETTWEDN